MRKSINSLFCGIVLLLCVMRVAGAQEVHNTDQAVPASQSFALADTKDLTELNIKAEAVEYRGRKAVRLTALGEDGLAFVNGTQFRDGTIEVDIATRVTTPPGVRMPGFIGIAFRARSDAHKHEM